MFHACIRLTQYYALILAPVATKENIKFLREIVQFFSQEEEDDDSDYEVSLYFLNEYLVVL